MSRTRLIAAAAASAALTITAVATAEAKVEVTRSTSPALARGSTFAWASVPAQGFGLPDPAIANEITAERLRVVTESTMAAKGYRQVADPAEADLLITYTIVMFPETDLELNSTGAGCMPPICGGLGGSDYRLDSRHHTRGTLVLDIIERQTGRLVWRAISDKRVKAKDASTEKLTALLNQMTKSLPQR